MCRLPQVVPETDDADRESPPKIDTDHRQSVIPWVGNEPHPYLAPECGVEKKPEHPYECPERRPEEESKEGDQGLSRVLKRLADNRVIIAENRGFGEGKCPNIDKTKLNTHNIIMIHTAEESNTGISQTDYVSEQCAIIIAQIKEGHLPTNIDVDLLIPHLDDFPAEQKMKLVEGLEKGISEFMKSEGLKLRRSLEDSAFQGPEAERMTKMLEAKASEERIIELKVQNILSGKNTLPSTVESLPPSMRKLYWNILFDSAIEAIENGSVSVAEQLVMIEKDSRWANMRREDFLAKIKFKCGQYWRPNVMTYAASDVAIMDKTMRRILAFVSCVGDGMSQSVLGRFSLSESSTALTAAPAPREIIVRTREDAERSLGFPLSGKVWGFVENSFAAEEFTTVITFLREKSVRSIHRLAELVSKDNLSLEEAISLYELQDELNDFTEQPPTLSELLNFYDRFPEVSREEVDGSWECVIDAWKKQTGNMYFTSYLEKLIQAADTHGIASLDAAIEYVDKLLSVMK